MRCADVIRKLEELSPLAYAESWDTVSYTHLTLPTT